MKSKCKMRLLLVLRRAVKKVFPFKKLKFSQTGKRFTPWKVEMLTMQRGLKDVSKHNYAHKLTDSHRHSNLNICKQSCSSCVVSHFLTLQKIKNKFTNKSCTEAYSLFLFCLACVKLSLTRSQIPWIRTKFNLWLLHSVLCLIYKPYSIN